MKEKKPQGYWNYDTCKEAARKYTKRVDFQRACSGAYNVARKNGWIKDYDWFCVSKTVKKWNYEICKEEAQKYKSKVEFQKGSNQAYQVARKNDWLKEYNWLVRPVVHNKKWVYETCKEEAKNISHEQNLGKNVLGHILQLSKMDGLMNMIGL